EDRLERLRPRGLSSSGRRDGDGAPLFASLIAENADREKEGKAPLGVADIGLSGETDVFVLHLPVSTGGSVGWKAEELPRVAFRAWMGADQESLEDYQEAAVASLR